MKCLCIFKIAGEGLLSACVAPNGNLKYLHKNAEQIVSALADLHNYKKQTIFRFQFSMKAIPGIVLQFFCGCQ